MYTSCHVYRHSHAPYPLCIHIHRHYIGRYDIKIPEFVIEQLQLEKLLEPILKQLKKIMGETPIPCIRTHNIVFAPVGSESQEWHCDDTLKAGMK